MSLIGATLFVAIATTVLAAGAIVTAVFVGLALRKQSRELRSIEKQVTDQQELTQQQARLLEIQGRQLDLQQKQSDQQGEERRRAQASLVFIWTEDRTSPLTQVQRAAAWLRSRVLANETTRR